MHELEYLRSEMNQRINYSYEHPHKVLGHLLLLWGGTLTLFGMSEKNFMEDIFLLFIVSTIFFISVVMIHFFSNREHENLNQIFRITAYNTIFHEKKPCIKEDNIFCWELATFKMMMKEIGTLEGKHNYTLSYEYFIFSLIATSINFFLFFLLFFKFSATLENMIGIDFLIIVIYSCYIIVSAVLSTRIYSNTTLNPQKWFDKRKLHLKSFIEYAKEIGYYTEDKIKERFGEDFWNEIYINR